MSRTAPLITEFTSRTPPDEPATRAQNLGYSLSGSSPGYVPRSLFLCLPTDGPGVLTKAPSFRVPVPGLFVRVNRLYSWDWLDFLDAPLRLQMYMQARTYLPACLSSLLGAHVCIRVCVVVRLDAVDMCAEVRGQPRVSFLRRHPSWGGVVCVLRQSLTFPRNSLMRLG